MDKELFGLGRTWWGFVIIVIMATGLLGFGKITPELWQQVITWVFGIAGGKSAVVGVAHRLKNNHSEGAKTR